MGTVTYLATWRQAHLRTVTNALKEKARTIVPITLFKITRYEYELAKQQEPVWYLNGFFYPDYDW